ncbi:FIG003737: Predicted deacylase [hydrothermal vent metagenome]|uniref:FIG003737: Predicted deacylase n=1 Tax=hydrothermal vent metagenome TaxID=652676 RepID=A0A3B0VA65_9ZZZZ
MKIAGINIAKGDTKQVNLAVAKLTSGTQIEVPVIVSRGKHDGPVLLLVAGLHGDEINSIDVVRSIIEQRINQVENGTVICVPILNIFGFINFSRDVPDGKDVNRSFPGRSNGSLASQIAYQLSKHVLPHCDYIIDFHTGGSSRFNIPQTRAVLNNSKCKALALAFNAPFSLHSNLIAKTIRETAFNQNKTIIVYEGGEALRFDEGATNIALSGTKKVIHFLNMQQYNEPQRPSIICHKRKWLRAPSAGFFHPVIKVGDKVTSTAVIGSICDPFGMSHADCIATKNAHVISLNNNPVVNRGDALVQIAYD